MGKIQRQNFWLIETIGRSIDRYITYIYYIFILHIYIYIRSYNRERKRERERERERERGEERRKTEGVSETDSCLYSLVQNECTGKDSGPLINPLS